MSKRDTFDQYSPLEQEQAAQALLTAWDCLSDYHDDLVLVGGLAIRYLTHPPQGGQIGAVTIDVDFGIHIGVSSGTFPQIAEKLTASGFRWTKNRFVRSSSAMELYIDLLTDDEKSDGGTAMVDESLHVGIVPGINRSLICNRRVEVTGTTLDGSKRVEQVRVAEVGPMLVLKLNAFDGRKAPKDAHDILYLVQNYVDGVQAAVAGFKAERAAGNRGMDRALRCLETHFNDEGAMGPEACARFRLGDQHTAPSHREESDRIRADCVTLAQSLLA